MTGFGEVAERLRRSTVQVLDRKAGAGGSGFILEPNSIVTNAHVVPETTAEVRFWDGSHLPARVVKHDRRRDLAVLQVDGSELPGVPIGGSATPRVGELAIAVGNPLGFAGAVSTGVVHAVGAVLGMSSRQWVQTTARLAPGSSGGPLANARGDIIGVNTMIVGRGASGNLALAIPADAALRFAREAANPHTGLGITVRRVAVPGEHAPGFLIVGTTPNQAADRASLLIGDLLIGVNGRRFRKYDDLREAITSASSGLLSLQFQRGDQRHRTVSLQLEHGRAVA